MSTVPNKLPVRVTDHCVLRFLERVEGMDVEAVRQRIMNVCGGYALVGAKSVRWQGFKFEMSGTAVTTVTPDHQGPSRTARDRNQHRIVKSKVTA